MSNQLRFEKETDLESGTWALQLDDGVVFYWRNASPKKLYVKWQGEELSAQLPAGNVYCKGAHGKCVYLTTNDKIYKAEFTVSHGINVSYLRDKLEDEMLHYGALCTREEEGKRFVYRMGDQNDKVVANLSSQESDGLDLRLLHRGKAVYISEGSEFAKPKAKKLRENVILIQIRHKHSFYARESSQFIYIVGGNSVYTLDTFSMEFLAVLKAEDIKFHAIAGVHNGVITVDATHNCQQQVMNAVLPQAYFAYAVTVNGETIAVEMLVHKYKEMEALLSEVLENGCDVGVGGNDNIELQNTIADLQARNAALIEEKRQLERVDQKMISDLEASNNELQSKNYGLSEKIKGLKQIHEVETEKLNKIVTENRQQIDKVTKENEALKSRKETANYPELMKKLDEYRAKSETIQRALDQANEKLNSRSNMNEDEISELKFNMEIKEAELESTILQLQTDVDELSEDNQRIQRECEEEMANVNDKLLEKISELTQEKNRSRKITDELEEMRFLNLDLKKQNQQFFESITRKSREDNNNELVHELRQMISENKQERERLNERKESEKVKEEDDTSNSLLAVIASLKQSEATSEVNESTGIYRPPRFPYKWTSNAVKESAGANLDASSPIPADPKTKTTTLSFTLSN